MRIGSLFSGAAMLDAAVEHVFGGQVIWHCENDKAAASVLAHHFPDIPNLGDITTVNWAEVEPVDVLCGGFPCFPAGTLIDAGDDGLRPIETLRVGDVVLTHNRHRRAVTSVMRRDADDVLVIDAMGAPAFRTTAEHPFWVRRRLADIQPHRGNRIRRWTDPQWVTAGELQSGDMLAMPLDDAGTEPILGESLAYIIGRWLGDGWIVDHKRTSTIVGKRGSRINSRVHKAIICCAHHEADELAGLIARAGLHATRAPDRTATKFHISSAELLKMLRPFGRGAVGKRLPGWVFTAPQVERAALLKGWLDADGSRNLKPPQWRGATISEQLAHGMSRLARDVHQVATSLHYCRRPKTAVIEGRTVLQQDGYEVVIPDRNREAFIDDGFAWVPVRSVTDGDPCEVFNISVDEDESYVAWGFAVHNCQDLSAAGRRAGLRQGTRSGLWVYFADAIAALKPRAVVIENVKGFLSARAHRDMESDDPGLGDGAGDVVLRAAGAVLGDLADLGYDAFWRTVSAASVGAPHLRERVFVIAIPRGSAQWESAGSPLAQEAWPQEGDGPGGTGGEQPAADGRGVALSRHMFPSPRGSDGRNGSPNQAGSSGDLMLPSAVMRLPTPNARDHKGAVPGKVSEENATKSRGEGGASSLADVACLLPTPVTTDAKGARNSTRGDRGQHQGTTLSDAIYNGDLLPTPSVADGLGGHINRSGDRKDEMLLGGIAKLLLPTPTARLGDKSGRGASHPDRRKELCNKRGGELDEIATHILPTPNARDYKGEGNWPGRKPRPDNGRIRGAGDNLLPDVVLRELGTEEPVDVGRSGQYLLPTPRSADYFGAGGRGEAGPNLTTAVVDYDSWGKYAGAIRCWAAVVGPPPSPTEPNTRGNPRLSPAFSEWMQGWPSGWVTGLPISRPDQLKICGNGVVPQQAAAALRQLLRTIAMALTIEDAARRNAEPHHPPCQTEPGHAMPVLTPPDLTSSVPPKDSSPLA